MTLWYHQALRIVVRSRAATRTLQRLYSRRCGPAAPRLAPLPRHRHRLAEPHASPGDTRVRGRAARRTRSGAAGVRAPRPGGAGARPRRGAAARGEPPDPVRRQAPATEMRAYARRHYGIDDYRLAPPARDRRALHGHGHASRPCCNTFATDAPDVELGELPGVCAHYVIDRDGTVYGLVPTTIMCRHTVGLNWTAIGIEHVGTSDGQVLGNRAPAARLAAADAHAAGALRDPHPQRDRARREPLEPLPPRAGGAAAEPDARGHGPEPSMDRYRRLLGAPARAGQHALTQPSATQNTAMSASALHACPGGPVTARPAVARRARAADGAHAPRYLQRAMAAAAEDHHHRARTTRACGSRWRSRATRSSARCAAPPRRIGREMKVPGFRSGKVPAAGGDPAGGARGGARRGRAPRPARAGTRRPSTRPGSPRSADPQVDLDRPAREGLPARLHRRGRGRAAGQARRLRRHRGRRAASRRSTPDEVQAELERVRESLASLETVERAAGDGRLRGHGLRRLAWTASPSRAARAAASSLELGSGRLVPGFEEQLEGASAGDERDRGPDLPRRLPGRARSPARTPSSPSTVKEVKEKRLPELDDELAVEAGGYDSLDELRTEIERAPRRSRRAQHRERVPPGRRGRRGRALRGRRSPRAGPRQGPRDVAPHRPPPVRPGRRPAAATSRSPARPRRSSSPSPSPTPSWRSGARRCSRRSSRPRASRSPTTR